MRVVIPSKLQKRVLDELHDSHLGIVKMKALLRSYVWQPNIDRQIKVPTKMCSGCLQNQKMPKKSSLTSVGVDDNTLATLTYLLCQPFKDSMFLVVVDAHSKWLKVIPMKSTTSSKTIEILRKNYMHSQRQTG